MATENIIEPGFINGIVWLPTRGFHIGTPLEIPDERQMRLQKFDSKLHLETMKSKLVLQTQGRDP